LRYFKSAKRVQAASFEDVKMVIGDARATKVVNYFKTKIKE